MVNDDCRFCFQGGVFTEPDIDMRGMIDKCVGIMAQQDILPDGQARALMGAVIPTLKRWRRE